MKFTLNSQNSRNELAPVITLIVAKAIFRQVWVFPAKVSRWKRQCMRMLLDRGVPKGVSREDFFPWRKIIPLGAELRWPTLSRYPTIPAEAASPEAPGLIDRPAEAQKTAKFPWFADEFIQLDEICTVYKGKSLPRLFGGVAMEGW